jgi:hypothetical protein
MELCPAIIASPFSTRCTLMDALIIVCLSRGNHYEWLRKGARRPAWWQHRRSCVRLLCVRRPSWRAAPSVSGTAGEGVQGSQGEGLGKGSVGKRRHTQEMETESPCNGQGARRHTCLERPQAFAACWCRYSGLTRTGL